MRNERKETIGTKLIEKLMAEIAQTHRTADCINGNFLITRMYKENGKAIYRKLTKEKN